MGTTQVDPGPVTLLPMTPPDSRVMTYSYDDASSRHLAILRDEARRLTEMWDVPADTGDSLIVALIELYTNVVTHVPAVSRHVTVILRLSHGMLTLRIRDHDPTIPVVPANPEEELLRHLSDESGRGLCMVAAMAERFYFESLSPRYGPGKTAVAEWLVAA